LKIGQHWAKLWAVSNGWILFGPPCLCVTDADETEAASVHQTAEQHVAVVKCEELEQVTVRDNSSDVAEQQQLPAFIVASSLPSTIAVVTSPCLLQDQNVLFQRQDVVSAAGRNITPAKCMNSDLTVAKITKINGYLALYMSYDVDG